MRWYEVSAVALRLHSPQLWRPAQEDAEHVGIERRGIALGGLLRHRPGLAFGAGVVHGRIKPSEARDGPIDEIAHLAILADIGLDELGLGAKRTQLGDERLAGLLLAAADDDAAALAREGDSGSASDSGQRTGD